MVGSKRKSQLAKRKCIGSSIVLKEEKPVLNAEEHPVWEIGQLTSDHILQYLTTSEILKFSLVCKHWNTSACEYLQRKRKCLMACKISENFDEIKKHQRLSKINPYQGIHFVIQNFKCKLWSGIKMCQWEKRNVKHFNTFKESLPNIKHVVVTYDKKSDSTLKTLSELLSLSKPADIETLTITMEKIDSFNLLKAIRGKLFKQLKVLEMEYYPKYNVKHTTFIQIYEAIIDACPVLEILNMPVEFDAIETFAEKKKLFLITWLAVESPMNKTLYSSFEANMENVKNSIQRLTITSWTMWNETRYGRMNIILAKLFFLRELDFLDWRYDQIQRIQLGPLPQVKKICVRIMAHHLQHHPIEETSSLNHPHLRDLFPNAEITNNFFARK